MVVTFLYRLYLPKFVYVVCFTFKQLHQVFHKNLPAHSKATLLTIKMSMRGETQ